MDILGVSINCPYWANRMENGVVTVRGFEEGKGEASTIQNEIMRLASGSKKDKPEGKLDFENITFLARKNRIGIDCSGLIFRIMEAVLEKKDMDMIFPLGIRKTNADMLTRNLYSQKIDSIKEIAVGDLIRLSSGHHAVIITHIEGETVKYVHSSSRTQISGVHTGEMVINKGSETIESQVWKEKTFRGQNWKDKYFHGEEDGVYRNKFLYTALNP
ncbi:hypothetical protein A3D77_06925 [Candidatus Gottesmanbacteria bacterium RIFCSPHIGHO2_02_FULL_39_11]|uniref:NlpC/P60 domain-containing protein n=1 Tax=Candidatus Gottesmanbacteria bacterium RIFCSPHIGHO2_02_FULL_39_11 TaxID=1798382 RepID=A0A1F5ZL01_9BACT|nr:MAG: hypothetical protein A3D77_06925 [Candidatus Gottesmanbacteria bacterium RIFCSPHIGHO2_02_FULL_39_11]